MHTYRHHALVPWAREQRHQEGCEQLGMEVSMYSGAVLAAEPCTMNRVFRTENKFSSPMVFYI